MTREQMLELIRESWAESAEHKITLKEAEKIINDFYDRREAGQNSEGEAEQPRQS